jgi:hypothetical protein
LNTIGQVRAASHLGEDLLDLENWARGANDHELSRTRNPYNWDDAQRIRALRIATDTRRLAVYRSFYDGLAFTEWREQFGPWLAETIRKEVSKWIKKVASGEPRLATFTARTVAEELSLHEHIEAICIALDSPEFCNEAGLILQQRNGPQVSDEAQWIVAWEGAISENQSA